LLEDETRTLVLVNPQPIKAVPGRKTAVKDSEWLADRLRQGVVQASFHPASSGFIRLHPASSGFIPPAPIGEVRELTRHRKALLQQRTQEVNRLEKGREGANSKRAAIKRAAVATSMLSQERPRPAGGAAGW